MTIMLTFTTLIAASAIFLPAVAASAVVKRTPVVLPSCTDFTPFTYAGCFSDPSNNPSALNFRATDLKISTMTVNTCVSFCKGNGYRYAGLEYYGICFCGSSVNGPQIGETECTFPCAGNKSETCGGDSKISVYQDPTFLPAEETDITEYESLGCYTEGPNGRTLPWKQDELDGSEMDVENCLTACNQEGYPFAGVEYGTECWCGVVLGNGTMPLASEDCDFPCAGNPEQSCGGSRKLNLYVARDLESREPCKEKPPVVSSSTVSSTTVASSSYTSTTSEVTTTSTISTTSEVTTTSVIPSSSESSSVTTTSSPVPSTTSVTPSSSESSSVTTTSSLVPSTTSPVVSSTTTKTTTSPVPTTTTTKVTTTVSLCTSTTTIQPTPTCEYKCGKWCSKPLPPFSNKDDCKTAVSNCAIQLTSCFLQAGWPESLKCFQFASWCDNVSSYCGSSCPGSKCSWPSCKTKYPPAQPPTLPSPSVSTSVFPCVATTTKATTTKVTTTASSSSVVPVPTHSCLCEQPHNPKKGYTHDSPVAGIALPCLTCNNIPTDYRAGNIFKLYNNADSSRCPSYPKPSLPVGCKKACDNQYSACVNVYAEDCRGNNKNKKWKRNSTPQAEVMKRTWGDSYNSAMDKCKDQWKDCYAVNAGKNGNGKCSIWNGGW